MEVYPKISVVVPVYNVAKYLNRCVDSILQQKYTNFEIILVDDGSTDGSSEICDVYSNVSNIKVYHKSNGGLSSARNFGISKVTGEYLSFIDSDDWINPNYFTSFISAMSLGADIIIGDYTLYINGSEKEHIHRANIDEGSYIGESCKDVFLDSLIRKGQYMSVWRNLYSLKFLKDNNLTFISEREIYAEDDYFNMIAYTLCKHIFKVNTAGYYHVIYKGSLSQSYRQNYFVMSMNRYRLKKAFLDEKRLAFYSNILEKQLPQVVSDALYKESLCAYSKAVKNVKTISQESRAVFSEYKKATGRYHMQYYFARIKLYNWVVVLSKLFKLGEPIYRFITLYCK